MPLTTAEVSTAGLPGSIGTRNDLGKSRRWGPVLCLALLSVVYLVDTCIRAASVKLWYDEIHTFDAAALLPSPHAFWLFLTQAEASPPLGFVLAAGSESIFGRNEFGVRFPFVIAFWIMALCLYIYLRRRLPWHFAIAAMLLTVLTAAGRYSHEARPYALVLALAGIALVAWQAAAEGRRRRGALVALAVALAAALCSHSMAVTLALPFLAGEITRTVQRKRVDWPVWCAFASAAPAVLVAWSVKNGRDFTKMARWSGSLPHHIFSTYLWMLKPAIVPLGLAFLLVLVLRGQGTGTARRAPGMRAYELAALVGFALIPFAAVPISTLSGQYWMRYSLNCTIGLAGILIVLLLAIGGTNRSSGVSVMAIFGVCFAVGRFLPENIPTEYGVPLVNSSEELQPFLERMPSDAPIVICYPNTFVELEHYSTPQLAARLYYLTEPAASAAIDGLSGFESELLRLPRLVFFRAHFDDYHSFIAAHKRFYVVLPIGYIAREAVSGRLSLQPRGTNVFQYYEANAR